MRYGTYTCGLANGMLEYGFTFGEPATDEAANSTGPCEIGDSEFDVVLGATFPEFADSLELKWIEYRWVAEAIMHAAAQQQGEKQ